MSNTYFVAVRRRWVPMLLWRVVQPTLPRNPLGGLFARPLTDVERSVIDYLGPAPKPAAAAEEETE
jgi:hypothetical protein